MIELESVIENREMWKLLAAIKLAQSAEQFHDAIAGESDLPDALRQLESDSARLTRISEFCAKYAEGIAPRTPSHAGHQVPFES